MAWRYSHGSSNPNDLASSTYTFNRATLLDFAATLMTPRALAAIAAPAAQPADSAMEDAMDDAMLAVVLAARDLDALIESGFGPVSRESASLHCALAAFDALEKP
jgi:hypothetical protein